MRKKIVLQSWIQGNLKQVSILEDPMIANELTYLEINGNELNDPIGIIIVN